MEGDVVALKIFNKDKWIAPSEIVLEDEGDAGTAVSDVIEKEKTLSKFSKRTTDKVKPTGCIVGIIRRKWRQYCGILQDGSDGIYQLFVPADRKIPKIRIETRQADVLRKQKLIVAIDSWPKHSRYPNVSKIYLNSFKLLKIRLLIYPVQFNRKH